MYSDRQRPAASPTPGPTSGVAFVVATALVLIAVAAFTALAGREQPLRPIQLATGEWAPYSGRAVPENGIAAAIVATVLRRAGYEPTFQFMPWERAEEAAAANEANGGIRGTFPYISTPEREREFYYSDPIFEIELSVFYNAARFLGGADIHRVEDLTGFDVVTMSGYRYPAEVEAMIRDGTVADDNVAAFTRLIESERPVVVLEATRVGEELLAGPLAAHAGEVRVAPLHFTTPIHFIASRRNPNNRSLIRDFNEALAALSGGPLQEIEASVTAALDLERMVSLRSADPGASLRAFMDAKGPSSVLLPEGTRAVVERWSSAYLRPDTDLTSAPERLRVRILNGPQRGQRLFVDPRSVVLP